MALHRATFRLYPTAKLNNILHYHRKLHKELYNAAVYNRITSYKKFGKSVSYFEQQNCLPEFKEVWTEYKQINSQALQATLKRVDFAFKRFFKGLTSYPKFKSIRRYSGWSYPSFSGWKCHSTGNNGYTVVTEQLEVKKMSAKAKKGKRKKQKAGLNKSILDVGMGMIRQSLKAKLDDIGGVFSEAPTKKIKPSQTCPNCGHQEKKTLDQRVHICSNCKYTQQRDIASAEVLLLWYSNQLPGFGTSLVDADALALLHAPAKLLEA